MEEKGFGVMLILVVLCFLGVCGSVLESTDTPW